MTHGSDPDDLSPEQRGVLPDSDETSDRRRRELSGRGRAGRLRSWFTAIVGLAAIAACYFLFRQTY